MEKPIKQRSSRLKLLHCAVELVRESTYPPIIVVRIKEKQIRFYGITTQDKHFAIQIKKN